MKKLFFKFIETLDQEDYLKVRTELINSPYYNPYSQEMNQIDSLIDEGKLKEARQVLSESFPNLLLSPGAHLTLSFLVKDSKDDKGAEMEAFLAVACCQGILGTGEGTQEKPYLIVRTSDEYDVIRFLKKDFKKQTLSEKEGRHLEQIECQDGSEVWFDITDPFLQLGKMMPES